MESKGGWPVLRVWNPKGRDHGHLPIAKRRRGNRLRGKKRSPFDNSILFLMAHIKSTGNSSQVCGKRSNNSEMTEGPQAFEAFRDAARRILSLPKTALPPDPFKKQKPQKKEANHR